MSSSWAVSPGAERKVFIDFEGIDGSGKTTLSNLLAARLRAAGVQDGARARGGRAAARPPPGASANSPGTRRCWRCARAPSSSSTWRGTRSSWRRSSPRRSPAARCASATATSTRSWRSRAAARGLPQDTLAPACEFAAQGLWPDLVILVDVEPELARLRKRLGKRRSERAGTPTAARDSRARGWRVRMREAFLEMARKDPARWLVIENNDQPLHVLEQRIVDAVVARLEGRPTPEPRPATPAPAAGVPTRMDDVEEHFFRVMDALEAREPQLAVWLLGGIPGFARPPAAAGLRRALPGADGAQPHGPGRRAGLGPARAAGRGGAPGRGAEPGLARPRPQAMALRAAALRARARRGARPASSATTRPRPGPCASTPCARGMLSEVLCGLGGRGRGGGLGGSRAGHAARPVRGRGAQPRGLRLAPGARCAARELLGHRPAGGAAQHHRPGHALRVRAARCARGQGPQAGAALARGAWPRDEAFAMRERGAPLTKEALDSLDGLEDPRAWRLREAFVQRWPATVVSSLRGPAPDGAGRGPGAARAGVDRPGACPCCATPTGRWPPRMGPTPPSEQRVVAVPSTEETRVRNSEEIRPWNRSFWKSSGGDVLRRVLSRRGGDGAAPAGGGVHLGTLLPCGPGGCCWASPCPVGDDSGPGAAVHGGGRHHRRDRQQHGQGVWPGGPGRLRALPLGARRIRATRPSSSW